MKYTENFGLPLYEYKDGADLVEGYNKTAEWIDANIGVQATVTSGSGSPTASGTDKAGDLYVDTSGPSLWVYMQGDDGAYAWRPLTDPSRPSMWFTGNGNPVAGQDYRPHDMYLDVDSRNVWMYVGDHGEDLTVDTQSSPIRLMQNGRIIARNWFYRQGTVSVSVEGAVGSRDIQGNPSAGGSTQSVRLPVAAYVTPFHVSCGVKVPYDLYYRLSAQGFDSGRHLEHHNADDSAFYSEAEVAIIRPSTYSTCVFTVDPGDGVAWDGSFELTTYGLYQAVEYAEMLQNGVRWFDSTGHIEYTEPWVYVCNLNGTGGSGACWVPAGGSKGQVLTKASNSDFDLTWADPQAADIVYERPDGSKGTVSDALDNLHEQAARPPIQTPSVEPVDDTLPKDELPDAQPGDAVITPSGDLYHVTEVTETEVIVTGGTALRGAQLTYGVGAPVESTDEKVGDSYIDTATGDLYGYEEV